jgi:inosose dehydratase
MALLDRLASAPISWGICEVPGWGAQLTVDRVLSEMSELGFTHTELGAIGWLPTDLDRLMQVLEQNGLSLLGGFVPLLLHDPSRSDETMAAAHEAAGLLAGARAEYFVTAAVSGTDEWRHVELDDSQWDHLYRMLAEVDRVVAGYGLRQVVHPHVDTVIENDSEVFRVLENTEVEICLDTAHLAIGGTDVIALIRTHGHRVGLVHLKDVDFRVAEDLTAGRLSLMQAVQQGVFPPLGRGELPISAIVSSLEGYGRDLWYVLEQDRALADGDPSASAGPIVDVRESIEFLRSLDFAPAGSAGGTSTTTQEG